MATFTDKASRTLKLQKAEKPKVGNGMPSTLDGYEGENRIQMVDGKPRLYYKTPQGWYYTGLGKEGETPNLPIATKTTVGVIKIGSGGSISSDGTYTAQAETMAADNITSGDAAVNVVTSSGAILVDSQASTTTIDGHAGVVLQGTNTKTITMGDGSSNFFVFNQDSTPEIDITGNFTMDCSGNVTIDADGGTITFSDGGSSLGTITSSGYSGTAAVATTVTITDNESTNENNAIIFTAGGDLDGGNLGLESDGDLHYNPSTGLLTSGAISAATITQTSLANVGSDVDKFVVSDGGVFKYRTGTQVASDIGLGSSSSPQFSSIELGHASDTTIARSSGGVVTIEGAVVRTGTVGVGAGGTGITDTPANGTLLIGDGTDYTNAALTEGSNITISVGSGSCTIAATDTNTMGSGFVMEDGDGTEVTITENKEVKFVDSTGIDIDWTDTSHGTDGDPYDLTFSLTNNLTQISELSDPGADRILMWDDSASGSEWKMMTAGTGLSISGTTMTVNFGDITTTGTVTSGTWAATDVAVAHGGTGASSAANARTNLGLGGLAVKDTINNGEWSGTVLAVGNGGTGQNSVTNFKNALDDETWSFANVVTANAGVVVDNITIDGSEIDNSSGNLTLDSAGDIYLDAGGADIVLLDDGTHLGTIKLSSSAFRFDSQVSDQDITFTGNDGGSAITALTLDMSEGGNATFGGNVSIDKADGSFRLVNGSGTLRSYLQYQESSDRLVISTQEAGSDILLLPAGTTALTLTAELTATFASHVYAAADVYAYYSSDPILKENKELIDNPLDKICKLGGYSFDWKKSAKKHGDHLEGKDYGIMADEVQSLFPELVQTRDNGIRAVKYDKLVPLLIEGIKELKQELNMIKGES